MNIGLIVDGRSEFEALPELRVAIEAVTLHRLMTPYLLETSPLARLPRLAADCSRVAQILRDRGADLVIVLVDRENREGCPPAIADELSAAITRRASANVLIQVVVKDKTFENWLISDPNAIAGLRGRFSDEGVAAIARAVAHGRADEVNALQLLERATIDRSYRKSKPRDSRQILSAANVSSMGRNSRSFRCFLRRLGHPDYPNHSRRPAQG